MIVAAQSRPAGPASRSNDHGNKNATSERRWRREAAEAKRRSGEAA
jgi:hypothetical protein